MHGPLIEPWPLPSAEIVPDMLMSPPLAKMHEPMQLIAVPAPTVKSEPADHTAFAVVAVEDVIDKDMRPLIDALMIDERVAPVIDSCSAMRKRPVAETTLLNIDMALPESAKEDGRVTEAQDDIVRAGHQALLLALPRVDALLATTNDGVFEIVKEDTPASTPDHAHDGSVTVDVGGSHSVEPDVSVRELTRGIMPELTGDADREHRNGRGGCIVNASLVDDATYIPPASTVRTFVTPSATDPAASQLT